MADIPYGRQYIEQNDIDAVIDVLKSDWLTQGPQIIEFENLVANYHKCRYAVAFSSGTAALHGAYYVSTKIPFGKHGKTIGNINTFLSFRKPTLNNYNTFKDLYWEYITTPVTFAATSNAGLYCGGAPKFVDIDLDTYCIDIEMIEDSITESTRVITPVSYAGYPADIKAIRNLPKVTENNICIIHDASHALGARREGHGIADFADMTVLSFHPVKHIATGEGGMILTNDKNYYEKLLLFRNHGITKDPRAFLEKPHGGWYYEMQDLGYNYRITDIQCALGISQMKRIDRVLLRRNQIARLYERELNGIGWITLPPHFSDHWTEENLNRKSDLSIKPDNLHSYHLYPILLDRGTDRKDLYEYMHRNGIGVQVHYIPASDQPFYSRAHKESGNGRARDFYQGILSIPMYYGLSDEEVLRVTELIRNYVL
ncbi:MAG: DegT/DnrJ/EryC1/StrS family aminotransferase [Eubacteriales bacterium]|nr:DegT/DnrJ/EryC1/StrS family aminotransferase [Eubacteriales bacterium]